MNIKNIFCALIFLCGCDIQISEVQRIEKRTECKNKCAPYNYSFGYFATSQKIHWNCNCDLTVKVIDL